MFEKQTGKKMLLSLAHSVACMNGVIESLESIGFNIDDNSCNKCLYQAFSGVGDVMMSSLDFPNVSEENDTYNKLIEVTLDNYEDIVEEIWSKYGVE